jgi:hypothetical protein
MFRNEIINNATLVVCACLFTVTGTARADQVSLAAIDDAYVEDLYPTSNFGASSDLYVGDENYNTPPATCRSYLKFDLGQVPPGATINFAELYLRTWGIGPNPPIVVDAHLLMTDGWNEMTITWSNAPQAMHPYPTDSQTINNTATWFVWDVTPDVQLEHMGDGVISLVMKTDPEGVYHSWCGFSSADEPDPSFRPYLLVDYDDQPQPTFDTWQDLTGVWEGDAQWGDFDGDGDLDLVTCGESDGGRLTRTYENQGGTLVARQDLTGVQSTGSGCLAWGDLDLDGDLDLALAGTSDSGRVAKIYLNDGAGNLTEDVGQNLVGLGPAAIDLGDVDLDGDLDAIFVGSDGTNRRTILYLNDGGTLTDSGTSLTGLASGTADWVDLDGDSDLDLMISGGDGSQRRVIFYLNGPVGTLVDSGDHGLPGVSLSDAAWGDCDGDGDMDLLYTGDDGTGSHQCAVYTNDGAGILTHAGDLDTVYRSSCAWGDYDNDGDLDAATCGYDGSGLRTVIHENTGSGFTPTFWLNGSREGSVSWADVDQDGDLDFFMTGADWSTKYARLYSNDGQVPNTPPTAPTTLAGQHLTPFGGLHLSWSGATDAETPVAGLYYALRVGSSPGADDIVSGTYATPLMGNVEQTVDIFLDVPEATYYWSVRAIDSGFMASDWAPEQICEPVSVAFLEIDPCDDAFVESSNPAMTYGAAMPQFLYVGDRTMMPGNIDRTYLKFQLTGVPGPAVVLAELHINRFGGGGSPQHVEVCSQGIDNWDEMTITWANAPTMFSPATSVVRVDQAGWCIFDVTSNVMGEVDGTLTLVLRINTPPEGTPAFLSEFYSKDYSVSSLRPYLKVWYEETTAVEPGEPAAVGAVVRGDLLEPATPNPFNPSTTIHFTAPGDAPVRLSVYDMGGRLVSRLVDGAMHAGRHAVVWDGRDAVGRALGSGVYFYRLETAGNIETRKMTMVK